MGVAEVTARLSRDADHGDSGFEGQRWEGLVLKGLVPVEHNWLIVRLQSVHDYHEVRDWPPLLAEVAEEYNLKFNTPS